MNNYAAIPAELRALPNWVVWRYEDIGAKKPTKVPYDAKNGNLASVNDIATWSNFDTAVAATSKNKYSGIGFVFSSGDPYSFIDLDDTEGNAVALERQLKIYKEFDSYSEISPSGNGLHIIIKGKVSAGRRRSFIEIYSSQRYATMTGNVYNDKPIVEQQDKLSQLWEQMGSGGIAHTIYNGDAIEKETDTQIIEKAKTASNADKFIKLLEGKWSDIYNSQSEADYAFIDIIAFYTQNRTQIERIFRASPLGQREKAQRTDYVTSMVNRSFDRMLPPIDFDGFRIAVETKIAEQSQLNLPLVAASSNGRTTAFDAVNLGSNPSAVATKSSIPIPPGLLGELAQYIYAAAPRPVPEIALAGAIGLMAGITGRAYNISGTGLNQYILLLAATGTGKEAAAAGIDKLMNTIRFQVPTSINFVGPSEIASGQALIKQLSRVSQCFVCVLGEFGLRIQQMSSQSANSAEIGLRRMLLDLYNKSGHNQILHPSIYADKEKNTTAIASPAFSILGESTPERFYGALNEEMISEGLLPRFMLIEYQGPRPPLNPNHTEATPSFQLIEKLASLTANCELIMSAKRVIDVQALPEANKIMEDFDKFADAQINGTNKEVLRQLWNRAHMKVLKISALIAVGVNMSNPIITPEFVKWGIDMVQSDIKALSNKFELGEIGISASENKQIVEITRLIKDYLTLPFDRISSYSPSQKLHHEKVIPMSYLSRRAMPLSTFRLDKMGATNALKRTIQTMIDTDKLREINKNELIMKYGTTQKAYILSDMRLLD